MTLQTIRAPALTANSASSSIDSSAASADADEPRGAELRVFQSSPTRMVRSETGSPVAVTDASLFFTQLRASPRLRLGRFAVHGRTRRRAGGTGGAMRVRHLLRHHG